MLTFAKNSRVLVVAPHVDDETHCGGTIKKLSKLGCEIAYVSFSYCAESLPDGFTCAGIVAENNAALDWLGVAEELRFNRDFPVRRFGDNRQEILENLIRLRDGFEPTVVISPASGDSHQDHRVVFDECERAFRRNVTLVGYLHPLNMRSMQPNLLVRIEDDEWEAKRQAWHAYVSQRSKHSPFNDAWINTLGKMWSLYGMGVSGHAEAFECIGGNVA